MRQRSGKEEVAVSDGQQRGGWSDVCVGGQVALPGHLKMKVRSSQQQPPSTDGDPAPSRPRGMGPGALGGLAVSRLAHSHSSGSGEPSPVAVAAGKEEAGASEEAGGKVRGGRQQSRPLPRAAA